MKDLINVLIVNHNQPKMTYDILSDLESQTIDHEITLINNGCGENKSVVDPINKNITVINNSDNIHLNKLWNEFGKNKNKYKYLTFLNNDVRIPDNFLKDTIDVFEREPNVGIVIHVTNNPRFTKQTKNLCYKIFKGKEAIYQGWDFTIRSEIYPEIDTEKLFIFSGDDYIFSKTVKEGWDIALVLSSPIIHHKEKTRNLIPHINNTLKHDVNNFFKITSDEGLNVITNTTNAYLCGRYCDESMEKEWKLQNKKEN